MIESLRPKALELKKMLQEASRVRITTHKSPDGDALGSLIAFSYICSHFGKDYDMVLDDIIPMNLLFLPRADETRIYDANNRQLILDNEQTDLVVFLDCGQRSRAGFLEDSLRPEQVLVNIDHHHMNPGFGNLNIICDISSTAEIIFNLMILMEVPLSRECAEALYTGIMTDTGSFVFEKSESSTYETAARLIEAGAVPIVIHQNVNQSLPLGWFVLVGRMIEHIETYFDGKLIISYISMDDIHEAQGVDLVNHLLPLMASVGCVKVYVLIREKDDGTVSASLRSKNGVDVSEIAAHFGGGGHKQAAACRVSGVSLHDFKDQFIAVLFSLLKDKFH